MAQYDVDIRDYWRIIKKRKTVIILMTLVAGVCSYGFAKLREPVPLYQAGSAIKIEQSSGSSNFLASGFWFPTESMDTHAYIITSFPVLVMTARELGWIPATGSDDEVRLSEEAMSTLDRLKLMVVAQHEQGTNIIDIQAISRKPNEAALIANAAAAAYREYNLQEKNRKTIETKKFIEQQLEATTQNLKRAERDLKAFKEGYGLVSIDAQVRNNLDRLYGVEGEYEKTRAAAAEIASKLNLLKKVPRDSIDRLEGEIFVVDSDSPAYDLRNKLGQLLLERQTLLIHLTEKHPQVIDIDDRIWAVVDELQSELEAQYRTLKGQERTLQKRLRRLRAENKSLPEKSLQLVRLQRELDLQETLYSELKSKYQETLIQESGQVEQVSIVRPAAAPAAPFNVPSKAMIVFTGIVMGLIIGTVLAFGVEVFDTSMGTIEDVEESLKVPVLGIIPYLGKEERGLTEKEHSEKERARDLIIHYDPKSLAAEAFRSLRTNLQFMSLEIKGKTFLITSSFVQEGKSLNVMNLALSIAQAGEKVLLVEGDLRRPNVYKNFGLQKSPGLTDFVMGNYEWKEVVNNISDVMLGDFEIEEILRTPGLDNLNILTAGTRPPNPTEILSSDRFRQFLKEASEIYNYIFIDAPPILPVADATEIAPMVDGTVLVYTVGKIGRGVLKRAKASLDNIDAKVLGVILNNVKPEIGPDYFKYHTQHYYGPDDDYRSQEKKGVIARVLQKLKPAEGGRNRRAKVLTAIALFFLALGILWNFFF